MTPVRPTQGVQGQRGGRAHLEKRSESVVTKGLWETRSQRLARPRIVTQPEVTTDNVLEQPDCLRLDELVDHVAENGPDGEEALVGMANISQPSFVEQDFLDNEDGNRLGEFGASLHDAEAERDDLCRKEEMYDCVVVVLLNFRWGGRRQIRSRSEKDRKAKRPTLTRAPMTPREVRRRYSKGRVLEVVFKKG